MKQLGASGHLSNQRPVETGDRTFATAGCVIFPGGEETWRMLLLVTTYL
jgi:hypothetical protein